jgi:arginine/lysine/ornithine decarboxylase
MSEPRDSVPLEDRYKRQARAAFAAATKAAPTVYSKEESVALIEAIGRVAAALILADKEGS